MKVHQVINSLFASNTWVIDLGISVWLVDCGDIDQIVYIIGNKPVVGVLLTHGHFDHIYGLNDLFDRYPDTPVYTNTAGQEMLMDDKKNLSRYHETPFLFENPECIRLVNEGDEIFLDRNVATIVTSTPGHNASCLTYATDDAIFTGDAYIPGLKVVTNLPGGNRALAAQSVERILELAKDRTIYPGHGDILASS